MFVLYIFRSILLAFDQTCHCKKIKGPFLPYSLTFYMQKQYTLLQCNYHHFSIYLDNSLPFLLRCIIIIYLVQVSWSLALFRLCPCWFLIFLCFYHHIMCIQLKHFLRLDIFSFKWPRNRTSSKMLSRANPTGWAMLNSKRICSNSFPENMNMKLNIQTEDITWNKYKQI